MFISSVLVFAFVFAFAFVDRLFGYLAGKVSNVVEVDLTILFELEPIQGYAKLASHLEQCVGECCLVVEWETDVRFNYGWTLGHLGLVLL